MLAFVVLAILQHSSGAEQLPTNIGKCSFLEVSEYISKLPDVGTECSAASTNAALATQPDNLLQDLGTFCTVDCGRSIAEFILINCESSDSAIGTYVNCLHNGKGRCRLARPDLFNLILIDNLQSCTEFDPDNGTCPDGCAVALSTFFDAIGCCYEYIYGSDVFPVYVQLGQLDINQGYFLSNITNQDLLSNCSVAAPAPTCTGEPFAGKQSNRGTCTIQEADTFIAETTSESCIGSLVTVFVDPPSSSSSEYEQALDEICTADCGGRVSNYYATECDAVKDSFLYFNSSCLRTESDSTFGPYCIYSLDPSMNSIVFTNAISNCLTFDPTNGNCPSGCSSALQQLVSDLGCCYQSIFNKTDALDLFFLDGDISVIDMQIYFL